MKLVVGLGNPGAGYRYSRHNLGFMVLDELARDWGVRFKKDPSGNSLKAEAVFKSEAVILAKPQTYMNLSGYSARKLLDSYGLKLQDMLVVSDDTNLELGTIRLRPGGRSGGHKGLASIIENLKSDDFNRLRVGVSGKGTCKELSGYVLEEFPAGERPALNQGITRAKEAAESWIEDGIEKTMNKFNKKKNHGSQEHQS